MKLEVLAPALTVIVNEAGNLATRGFHAGKPTTSDIWYKNGSSPVTASDIAVNDLLHHRLMALLPDAAWLSEETADNPARLASRLLWIVDPIDGTRAFIAGHSDWCVSVALVADGEPVLGNIYAPACKVHYQAIRNQGASCNGLTMEVSRHQMLADSRVAGPKAMIARLEEGASPLEAVDKIPSLALRLARVASGDIDIGLVSTRACDWDIAAAHLVLDEAGGLLSDLHGGRIIYNCPDPTHGELAAASKLLHPSLIAALGGHT